MKTVKLFILILLLISASSEAQVSLNRSHAEINLGIGRRAYINSKDAQLRGMASLNYVYKINNVFYLKTGLDINYWDHKFDGNFNGPGYQLIATSYEHFAYAWFLGGEIVMNRVIFQGGAARYIYFNHLSDEQLKISFNRKVNYYTKIGFKYLITKHVYAGFFLKAHSYEADYMDFGLGYKF